MKRDYIHNQLEENDTINIREEIEKYFIHWRWFVVCSMLALIGAYVYLRYSTPEYSASTSILIKDNQKSGISQELEAFKDLGIVGGSSSNNTDNEIEILKSRKIIGNVVDSLNLTISYFSEGRVKQTEIYNKSPVTFILLEKDSVIQKVDSTFSIVIKDGKNYQLKDADDRTISSHSFNEIVKSKLGIFKITRASLSFEEDVDQNIHITIAQRYKIIDKYRKQITISPVNKNSSVLTLTLNDAVKEKAEDILNVLVNQYNKDAIGDKNEVSEKTKDFIDERLAKVGADLSAIQDDVKEFKSKTGSIGLSTEGELALEAVKENSEKLAIIETEQKLASWIKERLTEQAKEEDILPSNLGFTNVNITEAINNYNALILQKKKLVVNAGVKNPQLIELKSQINSLKSNLMSSLHNLITSLEFQSSQLKRQESQFKSKISSIPVNERIFIDIARQQEIISGLYSYLLKKKEETAISLAVSVPNAKIIDVAYGSNIPVSPKRKIIFLAALLLGLIIPFIILYVKNLLDTKIHNKKDIEENLSLPFLGDIPKSDVKEKIVIGSENRSSSAEAFRLIRTNLDFMLTSNKRKESKTIFITSTTSGEGKSFISINIAASLAMSGKKTLLMGMDLRAPKVTEYLGLADRKGVTNYITDEDLNLDSLKFNIPEVKGLDIISSGVIPPNPAELLMTKRVENMFTIFKEDYDFIIVDTAPVNLVTDTLLIAKYADMFMYVVRANYLDKRLLAVPQTLYNEKRLPNMAVVLNDTDPKRSYGYGYGGYGYGYLVEEKPWYKKIFKS